MWSTDEPGVGSLKGLSGRWACADMWLCRRWPCIALCTHVALRRVQGASAPGDDVISLCSVGSGFQMEPNPGSGGTAPNAPKCTRPLCLIQLRLA